MQSTSLMMAVRTAVPIALLFAVATPVLAQPQHAEPKILEVDSSGGGVTTWRRVETRTTTGDTTVVSAAEQTPGIDGGWETRQETTTETIGMSSGATRVAQEVYAFDLQRQRVLIERTESDQARQPDGTIQSISQTWRADMNGRLGLLSRSIEEHRSDSGASETNTRLFTRDVNGRLTESARTMQNETLVSSDMARHSSSVMQRDLNGAWQPIETRQADVRNNGSTERQEEETVNRPDMNGVLGISERNVTRRSAAKGREDVVIERYVPRDPGAVHRSASRMELNERIRLSTTTAADGSRETIEEVEDRNPQAGADPIRVRRRVVTTVRPLGGDRSLVERRTFDLDPNGRLVLTATEHREGSEP